MAAEPDITRIVLTGGPCAGKTTLLHRIKSHFSAQGYHVFLVPEAATLVIGTGFIPATFPGDTIYHLQDSILELTLTLYRQTERLVRHQERYPALIIYDRGSLDAKAYCTPAAWEQILEARGISEAELGEPLYQGVIHLVTAADGARNFYSVENNPARLENDQQARDIDLRLRESWASHPQLKVIDNSTDFEGKIRRAVDQIEAFLP